MEYGQVCLRKGEEQDVRSGGHWIFDNEIDWVDEVCKDGDVVQVIDSRAHFLGWGFFNGASRITVRLTHSSSQRLLSVGSFSPIRYSPLMIDFVSR